MIQAPTRPTVSVVITTYNRAELCVRAVESALAQTYPHLEIIVVDDGSRDGTAQRLRTRFGSKILLISQENRGVSAARNTGVAAGSGALVALLDSDDYWRPEKTEEQVRFLETHPEYGMVLCNLSNFHADGRELGESNRRHALPRDGQVLENVLLKPALVPSSVMVRRALYESIGGFDETLPTAEDLDFHLRVAACTSIALLERPLARIARGDTTGLSMLSRTNRDHVFVVRRFVDRAGGLLTPQQRRAALFNVLRYNARSSTLSLRPLEGLRFAIDALPHVSSPGDVWSLVRLVPLTLKCSVKRLLLAARGG
jgi:glycosyltransferase involved in cell wall biosynthesis